MTVRGRMLTLFALILCVVSFPALAVEYTFQRVVGTMGGPGAVDGNGALARFNEPTGIVADDAGTVYVADRSNNVIRVINQWGEVRTLAGLAGSDCSAIDGSRSDARMCSPTDVALDSHGNLFVANSSNPPVIRKITPGGFVTFFAGANLPGYSDGLGTAAQFTFPSSLAIDVNDNIYVADTWAHTIRKITPAGVVTTLAGTGGLSGSADLTGPAARFNSPQGISVAADGNVYVADTGNHTIRRITPAGAVSTLAGTAGEAGYINASGAAARFNTPMGLDVDPDGHLSVADWGNHVIRKVTTAGVVITWAGVPGTECGGKDGSWSTATFCAPRDLFVNGHGTTFIADQYAHTIREITPSLVVNTVAGMIMSTGTIDGTLTDARFTLLQGVVQRGPNIYLIDQHAIRGVNVALGGVVTSAGNVVLAGTADANGTNARFAYPTGIVADSSGNLFVCDSTNHTIRKIDPSWNVTTFAGKALTPGAVDATGPDARFNRPAWIAIDSSDTLYVTEEGNFTVRKITPGAVVTTLAGTAGVPGLIDGTGVAARFVGPAGIGCDSSGNVLVNDQTAVRHITPLGVVTTLAGSAGGGSNDGIGSEAHFSGLRGLAVGADDTIFVASGDTIRRITTGAVVTTIGGNASQSGTEDGTGAVSRFDYPRGIAIDAAGNLLIVHDARLVIGSPRIEDEATIDDTDGPLHVQRTLDSSPTTATSWKWSIVRRPAGSIAELSSETAISPTFTPDVPDRYTFRLTATTLANTASITDVSLEPPCPVLAFGPSSLYPGLIGLPYAQTLIASNGTAPYRWEFQIGTLPPGITLTATGQLVGTPTTTGFYEFDVVAEDAFGCRGDGSYQILVSNGPPNLVATGTPASVTVSWTNTGAALYKIFRKAAGTGFVQIGTSISPTYNDSSVVANKAYAYSVKATVGMIDSAESNRDLATTHAFTDDPLLAGTIVRLMHLNQIRSAANSVRSLAGQSLLAITAETIIRKEPITTLQQAITEARSALGITAVMWIDITPGVTKVSTSHFTQLRNAVK